MNPLSGLSGYKYKGKQQKKLRKVIWYVNVILKEIYNECCNYETFYPYVNNINDICKYNEMPLLLVIMGEFKSGKSTFINTFLGEDVLKTDITPATAAVTLLTYGRKPKIILHKVDGTNEGFPIDMLHKLSSEGDCKYVELRKSINYIEVFLPVNILKYITIVDTPGLNSINQYHTQATKNFIENADLVLWLFSYTNVGTKSEIGIIESIAKTTKIIGVINRIDEHDPEEEDLDDFINLVHRKLQKSIDKVVGVSSTQACKALISNDSQLLKESRWVGVMELLGKELFERGSESKAVRMLSRLDERIRKIYEHYQDCKQQYDELSNLKETIEYLSQEIGIWKQLSAEPKPISQFLMVAKRPIPTVVSGHNWLNNKMKILFYMCNDLMDEREKLRLMKTSLDSDIRWHNHDKKKYEEDVQAYNRRDKGCKSISDLRSTEQHLNQQASRIEKEMVSLVEHFSILDNQMENAVGEVLAFGKTMCEAIKKAYNNLNVNMHSAVDGEVNKTLESLEWTTEFGCIWKCRIIFCIRKNTQKIRLLLMKTANNQKEELIKVLNGIEIYISANAGGKKGA